jgi:hypothetical protein
MSRSAMEGTRLARLIRMAIPFCRKAERVCARHGPGAPPTFSDWQIAVLIMVAVMARRKSKRAQYRYLFARRKQLIEWLDLPRFPGKTTYCERYRHAFPLFQWAVTLQGRRAIAEERVDPTLVAVDKSVIRARGRPWHRRKGRPCKRKRGADPEAGWTYSKHHGWVYGYSFEVVVTASRGSAVFPLDITAGPANRNEGQSFAPRIEQLPPETRYVAADAGYDANALAEAIEYNQQGQATKRHLLCPLQARGGKPEVGQYPHRGRRERLRRHRAKRQAFYRSSRGRRLYERRSKTVEPFNEWFKAKFELGDRVWHRGAANNATQIAAAMFAYQILFRYHQQNGGNNGCIQWILDAM